MAHTFGVNDASSSEMADRGVASYGTGEDEDPSSRPSAGLGRCLITKVTVTFPPRVGESWPGKHCYGDGAFHQREIRGFS